MLKMVYLENVHFMPKCIVLEIVDDRNVKRWKRVYTDKHSDYINDVNKLVEVLKQLAWDYVDDPSLASLLSDASLVTKNGYGINSWVRDDYVFTVVERMQ